MLKEGFWIVTEDQNESELLAVFGPGQRADELIKEFQKSGHFEFGRKYSVIWKKKDFAFKEIKRVQVAKTSS